MSRRERSVNQGLCPNQDVCPVYASRVRPGAEYEYVRGTLGVVNVLTAGRLEKRELVTHESSELCWCAVGIDERAIYRPASCWLASRTK